MTTAPPRPGQIPNWQGPQRRVGLTGGIATGKSSVGLYLTKQHALSVLDADVYAREALAPESAVTMTVLKRYGSAVTQIGQSNPASLDRLALGQIVFNNARERRWLENLVHPIVRGRIETELATLQNEPVVVVMIPLLFEAQFESVCDEIWVVHCSAAQQLERLMHRDQLSKQEAQARLAAQWPIESKTALADTVINNTGAVESWGEQVSNQIERLLIDVADVHSNEQF